MDSQVTIEGLGLLDALDGDRVKGIFTDGRFAKFKDGVAKAYPPLSLNEVALLKQRLQKLLPNYFVHCTGDGQTFTYTISTFQSKI